MRFLLIVILFITNTFNKENITQEPINSNIKVNREITATINLDKTDVYAGRYDDVKNSKYNLLGLPVNRKWLTTKEWKGEHIKSKKIQASFKKWKDAYIKKFIKDASVIALGEAKVHKNILPSIIVAQMILESNYGISRLSITANNYFGHKYYGKDKNDFVIAADDDPDDKFTKFKSRWFSIRSHTKLLMKKYHKRIKGKQPTIANWCIALCGGNDGKTSSKFVKKGNYVYATSCYKNGFCYAEKLKSIINKYKLHKLDEQIKK